MTTEPKDLYQRVTEQIIAAIEAGVETGRMPWHRTGTSTSFPSNAHSRLPYRGINVLALWAAAARRNYSSGVWATYKQWQELGAHVRRGEQGTLAVYWKTAERETATDPEAENEDSARERRFLARSFFLFNAGQIDGYTPQPELVLSE